jgi:hypothetical protein
MATVNVPLESLETTENMDFSRRGTPLAPLKPEHYVNKKYVDTTLVDLDARTPAVVEVTCNGTAETYTVTHDLNTTNIASVQIFDTTGDTKKPIGLSWTPTSPNAITLKPDMILPATMTLLVVVTA